jgi:hypothetical protein
MMQTIPYKFVRTDRCEEEDLNLHGFYPTGT